MTFVQFVDDDGKGPVASYVAGCAERIHCYVKGDDECLGVRTETKYTCQRSQCSHCCSTRYTRRCYHADAQE